MTNNRKTGKNLITSFCFHNHKPRAHSTPPASLYLLQTSIYPWIFTKLYMAQEQKIVKIAT